MSKYKGYLKGCSALLFSAAISAPAVAIEGVTGDEVVKNCYYKYAGEDQRSHLVITLQDESGKPVVNEFNRYWKNYDGEKDVVDKVILFTTSPPQNKGLSFMRIGYTTKSGKAADQLIYLPDLRKVRPISRRDPENKDWGINDEDLRIRDLDEDTHVFKEIVTVDGSDFYVVESTPKNDPVFSKRVTHFSKADSWAGCLQRQIDFYDKTGELAKQQFIDWDQLGKAWVWNKVHIKSTQNNASITYEMQDVEVNVGIKDGLFSKRGMKRGEPRR